MRDLITALASRAPTLAGLSSAFESPWFLDISAEILLCRSSIPKLKANVCKTNLVAGSHRTALQACNVGRLGGAFQSINGDIADLELRVGAVALTRGSAEAGALRDGEGSASHARRCQVSEANSLCNYNSASVYNCMKVVGGAPTPKASASAVWRITILVISPRLDIASMQCVVKVDILDV